MHNQPSSAPAGTSAALRAISNPEIITLLRREQFELDAGYDAVELAYRRGWNGRANELITWLSQGCVETGLAELTANAPAFDLSDCDWGDL